MLNCAGVGGPRAGIPGTQRDGRAGAGGVAAEATRRTDRRRASKAAMTEQAVHDARRCPRMSGPFSTRCCTGSNLQRCARPGARRLSVGLSGSGLHEALHQRLLAQRRDGSVSPTSHTTHRAARRRRRVPALAAYHCRRIPLLRCSTCIPAGVTIRMHRRSQQSGHLDAHTFLLRGSVTEGTHESN